jgi:hypothetical protein
MSLRKGKSPTNDTVSKSSSDDDKKTENAKLAHAISDRKEVSYADMVEGAKNLASYVVLPTSAHVAGLLAYASLFFTIAAGQGSLKYKNTPLVSWDISPFFFFFFFFSSIYLCEIRSDYAIHEMFTVRDKLTQIVSLAFIQQFGKQASN